MSELKSDPRELEVWRNACRTHVPRTETKVDHHGDAEAGVRQVCRELLQGWEDANDEEIAIRKISGGITNLLYRAEYNGEPVLVRIFGDKTELLIERERDNVLFHLLGENNVGPRFMGRFGNGRLEEWKDARPLEPSEMGREEVAPHIARALADMHKVPIPGDQTPCLWSMLSRWSQMVAEVEFDDAEKREGFGRLMGGNLPTQMRRELEWLKSELPSEKNGHGAELVAAAGGEETPSGLAWRMVSAPVFAHNDLLSGNVLRMPVRGPGDDEEPPVECVQIVDFEYGGFNYAGFDWANHFCEYAGFDFDLARWYPTPDMQKRFIRAYLQENPLVELPGPDDLEDELVRLTNKFSLASHLVWGTWAVLQARHSPIDFDFMEYASLRFAGYETQKASFFPDCPKWA